MVQMGNIFQNPMPKPLLKLFMGLCKNPIRLISLGCTIEEGGWQLAAGDWQLAWKNLIRNNSI
jgi:hypothetical protein